MLSHNRRARICKLAAAPGMPPVPGAPMTPGAQPTAPNPNFKPFNPAAPSLTSMGSMPGVTAGAPPLKSAPDPFESVNQGLKFQVPQPALKSGWKPGGMGYDPQGAGFQGGLSGPMKPAGMAPAGRTDRFSRFEPS